jgi:hypothetical protein
MFRKVIVEGGPKNMTALNSTTSTLGAVQ